LQVRDLDQASLSMVANVYGADFEAFGYDPTRPYAGYDPSLLSSSSLSRGLTGQLPPCTHKCGTGLDQMEKLRGPPGLMKELYTAHR
jgi:hypothetical protein